jgi:hypothetical protein
LLRYRNKVLFRYLNKPLFRYLNKVLFRYRNKLWCGTGKTVRVYAENKNNAVALEKH